MPLLPAKSPQPSVPVPAQQLPAAVTSAAVSVSKPPASVPPARQIEVAGPTGPDPTRYGDWERAGRCIDF